LAVEEAEEAVAEAEATYDATETDWTDNCESAAASQERTDVETRMGVELAAIGTAEALVGPL